MTTNRPLPSEDQAPAIVTSATAHRGEVSLRGFLATCRRRRAHLALPILVTAGLGGSLAYHLPDSFRAEVLVVAELPAGAEGFAPAGPGDPQVALQSVEERLFRRSLLERASRELALHEPAGEPLTDRQLTALKKRIRVRLVGVETVAITFDGPSAPQTAAAANRLAELLVEGRAKARESQGGSEAKRIAADVERLRRLLSDQEAQLRQSRDREEQLASQDLGRRAAILQDLAELQGTITENGQAAVAAGTLANSGKGRLDELRLKLRELRGRYTEQHPEVRRVKDEIAQLEVMVSREKGTPKRPKQEARAAQLQADLAAIDRRLARYGEDRSQAAPVAALMREYDANRVRYHELLEQLDRAAGEGAEVSLRIAEPARVPMLPAGPPRLRLLAMALGAGLGLGFLLVFLAEQLDSSFEDIEDFQAFCNLGVLAAIPPLARRRARRQPVQPNVVMVADPFGIASEQYRILAHRVWQQCRWMRSPVLIVTSAAGNEGKSTTAINLGLALAETLDGPVLLIDGDLRLPRVQHYLKLSQGPGLRDLLACPDADWTSYVHLRGKLRIITGGSRHSPSGPMLTASAIRPVLRRLRHHYACILLDSPPVLPTADSHVLADLIDGVLLVVRARQTPREAVRRTVASLDARKLLGVVLNDVSFKHTYYAKAYRYYLKHYAPAQTQT